MSSGIPIETLKHLSCGATNAILTNIPIPTNSANTFRVKLPSLPQSTATKLVDEGIVFKPFSIAI